MSCWSCAHHQLGAESFLGLCLYFQKLGRPPREIPADVVDAGCKFAKEKTNG